MSAQPDTVTALDAVGVALVGVDLGAISPHDALARIADATTPWNDTLRALAYIVAETKHWDDATTEAVRETLLRCGVLGADKSGNLSVAPNH